MHTTAWCHNGYHNLQPDEVIRRARLARIDALIVKYGDPAFERAITASGIPWGVERFAYAAQAAREADMLADAVDAGASFAVANCEPNDGGGWSDPGADKAIRTLIDAFRARHPRTPLHICADLRRGRSLESPFIREAARGGISGWMPMVYPKAFGQPVPRAFDAAYPGATYLNLPCAPVLQTYDNPGPASVTQQITEARTRGATAISIYVLETATEAELKAVADAKTPSPTQPAQPPAQPKPIDAATLQSTHLAYLRAAIAILDHGTPSELRALAELFGATKK